MILPRQFEDKSGKYEHLNGKTKLSYSQISSWLDPTYKAGYIKQYIAGIKLPSGIFAEFGSACGTYIEALGTGDISVHDEYKHLLSDFDKEVLEGLELPKNSVYEDLIVIDMGDFVIEGFMDRCTYLEENRLSVFDYKTGSIVKKEGFYASNDYKQTGVYAYARDLEGYEIVDCGVIILDRAGNNSPKSPLRLTGKTKYIETPYIKKNIEKFLEKDVRKVAKEISEYYTKYLELFK